MWNFLHRRGIVRTVRSSSNSMSTHLEVVIEAHPPVPRWFVARCGNRQLGPYRAGTHRLERAQRTGVTVAGRRLWKLRYDEARYRL